MKKILYFLLFLLLVPTVVFAQDYEKSVRLRLSDDDVRVNDYFDLSGSNVRWNISDPSILAIVDNYIKPIKVGNVDIVSSNGGDNFILHVEVVGDNYNNNQTNNDKDINQVMDDVKTDNPKTGDGIELLFLVVGLSFATIIFFNLKMKYGRFE